MEFLPFFDFLDKYIDLISEHKPFPVDYIHCSGGRGSGKSDNLGALFLAKALNTVDKVTGEIVSASGVVIKKVIKTVNNVFNEYTDIAKQTDNPPRARRYDLTWLFPGTNNYVQFTGWKAAVGSAMGKQGSGWAAFLGEYIIVVLEEAYEFTAADRQAIHEAVRTRNKEAKVLFIYICNPWYPNHEYIQFLNHYLPYNRFLLEKYGYQYKFCEVNQFLQQGINEKDYKPERCLFIHCNYKINKMLTPSTINNILKSRITTPDTADTAILGLPGYSSNSCYGKVIDSIKECDWHDPKEYIVCGGDIGLGGDLRSITSFVFGGYNKGGYLDIYDIYYWNNTAYRKSPQQVAEEVVDFYENCVARYEKETGIDLKQQPYPLQVRVDKVEVAFISMLNSVAYKRGHNWIEFIRCSKYEILDRVTCVNYLLHMGFFRINNETCKCLLDELSNATWDKKPNLVKLKRVNGHDHCINALEYGIEPFMYDVMTKEEWEMTKSSISNRL